MSPHAPPLRGSLPPEEADPAWGDPPPEARIAVVDEPWLLGPFACCHHPRPPGERHPTHFVLAGHLHPVCQLSGHALPAAQGRCFHAIGGHRVWALPVATTPP